MTSASHRMMSFNIDTAIKGLHREKKQPPAFLPAVICSALYQLSIDTLPPCQGLRAASIRYPGPPTPPPQSSLDTGGAHRTTTRITQRKSALMCAYIWSMYAHTLTFLRDVHSCLDLIGFTHRCVLFYSQYDSLLILKLRARMLTRR